MPPKRQKRPESREEGRSRSVSPAGSSASRQSDVTPQMRLMLEMMQVQMAEAERVRQQDRAEASAAAAEAERVRQQDREEASAAAAEAERRRQQERLDAELRMAQLLTTQQQQADNRFAQLLQLAQRPNVAPEKLRQSKNVEKSVFNDFIANVQRYATTHGEDPATVLPRFLDGEVKRIFLTIKEEERVDFDVVAETLRVLVTIPPESKATKAKKLVELQQGKETTGEFAQQWQQAFMEVNEDPEVVMKSLWINALEPRTRDKVLGTMTEDKWNWTHNELRSFSIEQYNIIQSASLAKAQMFKSTASYGIHPSSSSQRSGDQKQFQRQGGPKSNRGGAYNHHQYPSHQFHQSQYRQPPQDRPGNRVNRVSMQTRADKRGANGNSREEVKKTRPRVVSKQVVTNCVKDDAELEVKLEESMQPLEKSGMPVLVNGIAVPEMSFDSCAGVDTLSPETVSELTALGRLNGQRGSMSIECADGESKIYSTVKASIHMDGSGLQPIEKQFAIMATNLLSVATAAEIGIECLLLKKTTVATAKRGSRGEEVNKESFGMGDVQRKPPIYADAHMSSQLKCEQKKGLQSLMEEFEDVFVERREGVLAGAIGVQHQIVAEGDPIKQAPRRQHLARRRVEEQEIETMLAEGVIQSSSSPWASPVVMVSKPDGTIRFCVDYQKLNAVTKKDAFPLPHINDLLEFGSKARFYSLLDCFSGYWQIPMAPESVEKTAFCTTTGLYEFVVMPFGLTNAGATFQRYASAVIQGIPHARVYIDDIAVASATFEEHLEDLRQVFKRLRAAKLKLKAKKCHFAQPHVVFLGYKVEGGLILPDPKRVQAMAEYKAPQNLKQLRTFMGAMQYSRRFIKGFANIARPLNDLTKGGVQFKWSNKEQEAFETLNKELVDATAQSQVDPDPNTIFTVETDASNVGLGAALYQRGACESKTQRRLLAFQSKTLTQAESHYATIEKEALAIVWAFKTLRHMLEVSTHPIEINTDHKPLIYIFKSWAKDPPSDRIARWVEEMRRFQYEVTYKPGKENQLADAMSRIEVNALRVQPKLHYAETQFVPGQEDQIEVQQLELQQMGRIFVMREEDGNRRVFVPRRTREKLVRDIHGGPGAGHYNWRVTVKQVRDKYFWPGLVKYIRHEVQQCATCKRHNPGKRETPQLKSIKADKPRELYAVDVLQLPVSRAGHHHVLVVIDVFSRYMQAEIIRNQSADEVTKVLDNVFKKMGCPQRIMSDNGTCFRSASYNQFMKDRNVVVTYVPPAYPQGNGVAERCIGTLVRILAKKSQEDIKECDQWLPEVVSAYLDAPHSTTGRKPKDLLNETENSVLDEIRARTEVVQASRKASFDKRRAYPRTLAVGDELLVFSRVDQLKGGKLSSPWRGPYVVEVVGDTRVKCRMQNGRLKWQARRNVVVSKHRAEGPARLEEGLSSPAPV